MALFMKVLKLETSYLVFQRFDTVWHDNIVFKLTQNGISENLLNLLHDFLNKKKQRVVLNGQFSIRKNANGGVH